MAEEIHAWPLAWPVQWPRTAHPDWSRFKITAGRARDDMLGELASLGARDIVVSTNVKLRRDGLPYADHREPDDAGVAVYFTLKGERRCIPCDRWRTVRDNMRAIGLTVAALRGLERWGAHGLVDAAFAGFAALPAGDTSGEAWWTVLGVRRDATDSEVRAAYRLAAMETHPDHGGNAVRFHAVQVAYEQGLKAVGQ